MKSKVKICPRIVKVFLFIAFLIFWVFNGGKAEAVWRVDLISPTATLVVNADPISSTFTLELILSDNHPFSSGLKKYELLVSINPDFATSTVVCSQDDIPSATLTLNSECFYTAPSYGTYYFRVKVSDYAGNMGVNDEEGIMGRIDPWFQTQGGDVHGQGGISSLVPEGEYFCKDINGYPGVVSYGTGSDYDFSTGSDKGEDRVSSKGWLAKTDLILPYNFTYFYNLLDSPTNDNWNDQAGLPANPGTGKTEIYYEPTNQAVHLGGFTIVSGRKVVILSRANVIVEGNTIVNPGGFLAVISSAQINIAPTVSQVQGMYTADGHISTGSAGEEQDNILFEGQGIFYSPSLVLARSPDPAVNFTTPAELFIFRPDLVLNAPSELWVSKMSWQEVAP